jgi:hypothetical protein
VTDKPETPSQQMNRLIRELGAPDPNDSLMVAIRRSWAKPATNETEETDRG